MLNPIFRCTEPQKPTTASYKNVVNSSRLMKRTSAALGVVVGNLLQVISTALGLALIGRVVDQAIAAKRGYLRIDWVLHMINAALTFVRSSGPNCVVMTSQAKALSPSPGSWRHAPFRWTMSPRCSILIA